MYHMTTGQYANSARRAQCICVIVLQANPGQGQVVYVWGFHEGTMVTNVMWPVIVCDDEDDVRTPLAWGTR